MNIDLNLYVCINTDYQNVKYDRFYARYLCTITRSTVVSQRICLTENLSYSQCLTVRMSHTEHVDQKISDAEK